MSDVRKLFGLLSYFRKFVHHFSKKAKCITNLMVKENVKVTWTEECELAKVGLLNEIITSGLKLPVWD